MPDPESRSPTRILLLVLLLIVAAITARQIQRLPGGLELRWEEGRPVLLMTDSIAGADSIRRARAEVRAVIERRTDTYLADMLPHFHYVLWRWPERIDDPIRVHIERSGPRVTPEKVGAVRSAFERWSTLDLPLGFRFVGRREAAELSVLWADTINHPDHRRNVGGYFAPDGDANGRYLGGEIWIGLRHPDARRPWSSRRIYEIALHEVGHALGLHHSPHETDVMWYGSSKDDLSPHDVATVELLYSLPPGPVTDPVPP